MWYNSEFSAYLRYMKSGAYHLMLEISDELRGSVYERKVMYEKLHLNGLRRKDAGVVADAVRDLEWANISLDWLDSLTNPAKLFIINHIVPSLKLYNLLWYRPVTRKTSENRILKELVDNKVIFRTEVSGFYIVNPVKVWRGNPLVAVEETKELLRVHRRPSLELIKDRRPGDEYTHKTEEDKAKELGL